MRHTRGKHVACYVSTICITRVQHVGGFNQPALRDMGARTLRCFGIYLCASNATTSLVCDMRYARVRVQMMSNQQAVLRASSHPYMDRVCHVTCHMACRVSAFTTVKNGAYMCA